MTEVAADTENVPAQIGAAFRALASVEGTLLIIDQLPANRRYLAELFQQLIVAILTGVAVADSYSACGL